MVWAERYPEQRLVAYDPEWPTRYSEVARSVAEAMGPDWVMEHAGSTSVPGLSAKPVIDLVLRLPGARRVEEATQPLLAAGWSAPVAVGDHWATFYPATGRRMAIGHIFTARQWPEAHLRLFAGWLRSHPTDRRRYEDLKRGLVSAGIWGADYTLGKTDFVTEIVNKARQERGLPPVAGTL
jgi:GrpB-like predicted nucleotidyltransferase (UPF0157 family)